jgi:hypothetical protein
MPMIFGMGSDLTAMPSTDMMYINPDGHIGVGSNFTPGSRLSVQGNASFGSAYANIAAPVDSMIVSGNVGIGTTTPGTALQVEGTTSTTALQTLSIGSISPSNVIDFTGTTLSNVITLMSSNVKVSKIDSLDTYIDVSGKSLCNLSEVKTMSAVTPSITSDTGNVSFGYNRVLDVDSLVVRSNITVTFTGTETYTNLPTDLVRLDAVSGKILDSYISCNIVRLMQDGTLNPALFPVDSNQPRSTLLRTTDKVGIGLRNPAQKLHVNGYQCITNGRLGIGTTTPLSALHIKDDNSGLSTFRVDNQGSTDTVEIYNSNLPVFCVTAASNVGVRTSAPSYALDVTGRIRATDGIRTNFLETDGNSAIDCRSGSLSNLVGLEVANLKVTSTLEVPATITSQTVTTNVTTDTITPYMATTINVNGAALQLNGYDSTLASLSDTQVAGDTLGLSRIGLNVTECIKARALLTTSDRRAKTEIVATNRDEDFTKVMGMPVHHFAFKDVPDVTLTGFIAQEIEEIEPTAVKTTVAPIPSVLKTGELLSASEVQLEGHGLVAGSTVKLVINKDSYQRKIVATSTTGDAFNLDTELPYSSGPVFVYGEVINDFKMLDTERLVPLLFSAVQILSERVFELEKKLK